MLISYIYINIIFFIYFKDPNLDLDICRILQLLEGYPRTPDSDKNSKIMDLSDYYPDPDPDTFFNCLDTRSVPSQPI